jgi:hypothetical protein
MTTAIRRGGREARVASNRALFRTVDEQLQGLGVPRENAANAHNAVCECANDVCFEQIDLTPREYETLHETAMRFAVAPQAGHVFRDLERVVEQHELYWIVQEDPFPGNPRRVARAGFPIGMTAKRRRALKKSYLRQQKAEARARMVLDEVELDDLLRYLDLKGAAAVCDQSLRLTFVWASQTAVDQTQLAGSLAEFDASCDCEVLLNLDPETIF